ncbi:MAG: hypothetical protein ACFFD9_00635 [Candidatus Thorarchaeota archaeon]
MMNKFQDLMEAAVLVKVVVDANADKMHFKTVEGVIKHVGREYIEIERPADADEKSRHKAEKARVIVPVNKIAEVIYYQFE